MIEINVPMRSFSGNHRHIYTRNGGMVFNTAKYNNWIKEFRSHLPIITVNSHVRLLLTVELGYADKRRRDIDNALKSIMDACNCVVFGDDSQIYEIHAKKVDSESDYIKLCITELNSESK